MRWVSKALVQGGISLLPRGENINFLFQKYVTRNLRADHSTILGAHLTWCAQHIEHYLANRQTDQLPETILELGTGWIPSVPIGLFLCGATCIYTIDIRRLIMPSMLAATFAYILTTSFEDFAEYLPRLQRERFEQLQSVARLAGTLGVDELLARLNIHALIMDARATQFESGSIDLIISNTTLEHIAEPILNGIFKEFRRIIRPTGLMSHLIDMSDHYSHFDHSITPYNFLKYSSGAWRFFNNDLQYQNRLRLPEYQAIHRNHGFEIIYESVNSERKSELAGIEVAPEFRHFTAEELAPIVTWTVSSPV